MCIHRRLSGYIAAFWYVYTEGSFECMSGLFDICNEQWKLTGKGSTNEALLSVFAGLF